MKVSQCHNAKSRDNLLLESNVIRDFVKDIDHLAILHPTDIEITEIGLRVEGHRLIQIIQRMGGLISVHSIRGQGACFRLELNAVSDSAAEKPKDISAKSMSTKSGRILIIDDDPLVARSIKRMLRRYQVTTVQDGSTALELAAGEDFDLKSLIREINDFRL